MRRRDVADYGFLSVVWGMSFAILEKVVRAFGWVAAVAFRALLAGVILLALAGLLRRRLDFSAGWRPFAIIGATTVAAQLTGMSYSLPRIGTAMAAIIVATIPLFSMVLGHLWGLERIRPAGRVGLALGVGGIVLLVGFPATPMTGSFLAGCAASLAASLAAAFGSNYARWRLSEVGSWEVTTGAFIAGGLLTLPFVLLVPVPRMPAAADFGYLLLLGAVMSALAYVLYFRLVADLGATIAVSVDFVVTAVAVLVGAVLLRERLSLVQLAGAAVIITGCSLILGIVPGSRSGPRRITAPAPQDAEAPA